MNFLAIRTRAILNLTLEEISHINMRLILDENLIGRQDWMRTVLDDFPNVALTVIRRVTKEQLHSEATHHNREWSPKNFLRLS